MRIQPLRLIVSNSSGEHLGLPGPCRKVEALQLLDGSCDAAGTFESSRFGYVLPSKKEAHHLLGRNGLDRGAKP
jgi:hypothetical protein